MENHVAFVHEEKKIVACTVCKMKFKKLNVLNKHIASDHLSEDSQDFFENDTDDFLDDTEEQFDVEYDMSDDTFENDSYSFSEDQEMSWEEYLDLKPDRHGKIDRGYLVKY